MAASWAPGSRGCLAGGAATGPAGCAATGPDPGDGEACAGAAHKASASHGKACWVPVVVVVVVAAASNRGARTCSCPSRDYPCPSPT